MAVESDLSQFQYNYDAPKKIFSGIQPTGVPHLGNYLGALRNWVKLQNDSRPKDASLIFSIVDYHAATMLHPPMKMRQWRLEMLASLIAVGINPRRSLVFFQSAVPQHAELMWLLSCVASTGALTRMTQWKSKMSLSTDSNASPFDATPNPKSQQTLKLGLFAYPVLQAADILLYDTTDVPVGEDQAQHLELTRDLANMFNKTYPSDSPLFNLPKTILAPAKRVMSLTDPTRKMSKSDPNPASRILISDTREEIQKKIKNALTDSQAGISYDRNTRPGISNLIDILYYLDESAAESPADLASSLSSLSIRALKEKVADSIEAELLPVRAVYEELIGGSGGVQKQMWDRSANSGAVARRIAGGKMESVKRVMGLMRFTHKGLPNHVHQPI